MSNDEIYKNAYFAMIFVIGTCNASAIAYKRFIEMLVLPFSISDKYALSIPTITAKSICNKFCCLRNSRIFEPIICNLLLKIFTCPI